MFVFKLSDIQNVLYYNLIYLALKVIIFHDSCIITLKVNLFHVKKKDFKSVLKDKINEKRSIYFYQPLRKIYHILNI